MQHIPLLLQQFLTLTCAMTPDEVQTLWTCLPLDLRHRLRYQVERLGSRKPYGQAGDIEAMKFVEILDPRRLIAACEQAVAAGQVRRHEVVRIEECLLAEMDAHGAWK